MKNQPENCKRLYKIRDTELNITKVFDSGDAGGIVCTVLEENKEVLIVSLTHLQIKPTHPLSEKIVAYQRQTRFNIPAAQMHPKKEKKKKSRV